MLCAPKKAFDSLSVKGVPVASRSRQSEEGASVCGSADGVKRACTSRRLMASRLARAPCMTTHALTAALFEPAIFTSHLALAALCIGAAVRHAFVA
jgi:hypothetical protein